MNAKESAAMNGLLGMLESRYAMRVLLALRDGQVKTFRLLQDAVDNITPNTLNTRLKELRDAGLVTHNNSGYCATPLGADLIQHLNHLPSFALQWAAHSTVKKAIK